MAKKSKEKRMDLTFICCPDCDTKSDCNISVTESNPTFEWECPECQGVYEFTLDFKKGTFDYDYLGQSDL